MKDKIMGTLELIIGLGIAGYAGYLFYLNAVVSTEALISYNQIINGILILIGIFILANGVYPICLKRPRITHLIFGIFLMLFGAYALKDNIQTNVFTSDIIKIVGAIITVLGPLGVLVPQKCKKKAEEAKMEIIEV